MAEIEIEYCVPCGLLPAAERAEHALLEEFGQGIDGLRLKPSHGGVLRISVDGELIFDKERDGFDPDEIVSRARARIGATGASVEAPRRR
jgi:selenoprotein W-related protein